MSSHVFTNIQAEDGDIGVPFGMAFLWFRFFICILIKLNSPSECRWKATPYIHTVSILYVFLRGKAGIPRRFAEQLPQQNPSSKLFFQGIQGETSLKQKDFNFDAWVNGPS